MSAILKPSLLLAAWLTLGGPAAAEVATPATPAPKSQPEITMADILAKPMIFYLAKGEGDACGPGCSEWIAAEGHFDPGAPQRLRALLTRLGKRQLPIFFHSPGGLTAQAMAIGRFLRERQMTTGVLRTIPSGCAAGDDEPCRALKRSGQTLPADTSSMAACNSACVTALIGGKVRQVPPGARLGVHSGKALKSDPDGRLKAIWQRTLRRYYEEMGIAAGLFDLISQVPFERAHYLSRDEIAAFGIDRCEFQETRWMAGDPTQAPSVLKLVVEANGPSKGASRKEFRIGVVRLACGGQRRLSIGYIRGLHPDEIAATRLIKLTVADRDVLFSPKGTISKIDSMETNRTFDARYASGALDLFQAASARDSIDIVESDPTDQTAPPRTTKLSTAGLAKALEALEKSCGQPPAFVGTPTFVGTPAVRFLDMPGAGAKQ
jgi:hypothetical protein